ncbi:MAG: tetratricopeptide repeat-containing sulfotransferase family protein [Phycisphaerales bacterium]
MSKRTNGSKPRSGGRLRPAQRRSMLEEAGRLRAAGALSESARVYASLLEQDPNDARAAFEYGSLLVMNNRLDDGVVWLRRAASLRGHEGRYQLALAGALLQIPRIKPGELTEATAAAERAIRLIPDEPNGYCFLAAALERARRLDDAAEIMAGAADRFPDHPKTQITYAHALKEQKNYEKARARLEPIVHDESVDVHARQSATHELADIAHEDGRYHDAADLYERAGALAKTFAETNEFDANELFDRIRGYCEAIDESFFSTVEAPKSAERQSPIFLLGFNRSGTTLIEQALAAHPRVITSDEQPVIPALRRLIMRESNTRAEREGEALRRLTDADRRRRRSEYWTMMERALGEPVGGRVLVDKLPLNTIELPVINALFPQARVIVALRDPRDVCLSCVRQSFRLNIANIHFLSMGDTVRLYSEVMNFWWFIRDRLTVRWTEAPYERFVHDFEHEARRLLEFAGLEWSDEVKRYHEKAGRRLVSTPSAEAVSRPVYTGAIGRWRPYAFYLEPHLEALQLFIDAFGAERSETE